MKETVMRSAIASIVLGCLLVASVRADDLQYGTVSGWGAMIDPDGDCSFLVQNQSVTIQIPGTAHGLSAELSRMNAPRILQDIRGDFAIEVQVAGAFAPGGAAVAGRTAYNGAGLVLWLDEANYIRLERAVLVRNAKARHYVNFEQRIDSRLARFGRPEDYDFDENKPCYLRLERKGVQVLGAIRQSKQEAWHQLGAKTVPRSDSLKVGVAAINASDKPFGPQFSELRLSGESVKEMAKQPQPKPDRYAVPEADVEELVAFIKRINSMRPRSSQEYRTHALRAPKALAAAADRILKAEDASDEARRLAQQIRFNQEIRTASSLNEKQQRSLLDRLVAFCTGGDASDQNGQLLFSLARSFESAKRTELAAEAYLAAAEIMNASDSEPTRKMAEKMVGAARRMKLLGNEMDFQGELTDGKRFDLSSYRGKVVLVDFWATWCGPCIAELPNVKRHYGLYHDKGFEVVGVCLDTSREKLEAFIEDREIPWVNLFEEGAGWDHPVATRYGIMGIPTVILINREGKAISLSARGPELGKLLAKEFGSAEPTESEDDTDAETSGNVAAEEAESAR